jgi:hypothetical protein
MPPAICAFGIRVISVQDVTFTDVRSLLGPNSASQANAE